MEDLPYSIRGAELGWMATGPRKQGTRNVPCLDDWLVRGLQLLLYRLEQQIWALDAKLPDVNAARMLLKISTMVSRLNGLE